MRKFVFLALLFLSGITASAQYYGDIYEKSSYDYVVGPEIDLTGEQWHLAGVSILAATNNLYLIVDGTNRFVRTLRFFDRRYYERLWRCRIASYRPYYYNGCLGWYIVANLVNYFVYPNGRWIRLSAAPCYYSYHYDIAHRHRLNFYNWHFWKHHPRPHYRPHKHYSHPVYSREYRHVPERRVYHEKRVYRGKPAYRSSEIRSRIQERRNPQRHSEYKQNRSSRQYRSSASGRQSQREVMYRR